VQRLVASILLLPDDSFNILCGGGAPQFNVVICLQEAFSIWILSQKDIRAIFVHPEKNSLTSLTDGINNNDPEFWAKFALENICIWV
jgi:hypothetical protein